MNSDISAINTVDFVSLFFKQREFLFKTPLSRFKWVFFEEFKVQRSAVLNFRLTVFSKVFFIAVASAKLSISYFATTASQACSCSSITRSNQKRVGIHQQSEQIKERRNLTIESFQIKCCSSCATTASNSSCDNCFFQEVQ